MRLCSRLHRRRCRQRQCRPCNCRHTRRGRRAGCRHSHSRLPGYQEHPHPRSHRIHCKRRKRQACRRRNRNRRPDSLNPRKCHIRQYKQLPSSAVTVGFIVACVEVGASTVQPSNSQLAKSQWSLRGRSCRQVKFWQRSLILTALVDDDRGRNCMPPNRLHPVQVDPSPPQMPGWWILAFAVASTFERSQDNHIRRWRTGHCKRHKHRRNRRSHRRHHKCHRRLRLLGNHHHKLRGHRGTLLRTSHFLAQIGSVFTRPVVLQCGGVKITQPHPGIQGGKRDA